MLIPNQNAGCASPGVFLCALLRFLLPRKKNIKTPFLLLAALWVYWSGPFAGADCGFQSTLPEIAIRRVVDGDTLIREDGARLRLASVNTPELASGGGMAQALAFEARKQVEAFVEQGEHF